MSSESTQLIVLSMHRSGSSALMAMIEAMGAHIGAPNELLSPSATNPRGYWERRDVHDACRLLMRNRKASWWKVHALSNHLPSWKLSDEEVSLFAAVFAPLTARPLAAIKEPMFCLAMPAVLPFLRDARAIFLVRHPLEISRSLQRRNGFSNAFALALWEFYMTSALSSAARLPTLFIAHRALMTDPCSASATLPAAFPDVGLRKLSEAELSVIIEPKLNHHAVPHDEIDGMTPSQIALWHSLQLLSNQMPLPVRLPAGLEYLQDAEMQRQKAIKAAATFASATTDTGGPVS
jgi:hypothetical protein